MVGVVPGECPYPIRAQEFILIEHARKNSAQSFRINQRGDSAIAITKMASAGGMNALAKFGHAVAIVLSEPRHHRYPFALPGLDDGGGTER